MFKLVKNRTRGRIAGIAALGLLALAAAVQSNAACTNLDRFLPSKPGSNDSANFVPAVYRPDGDPGAALLAVHDSVDGAPIVGLWQFKLDGFSVDWGTQAWHSDGTEIMFSAAQNPATGDVCQGVWRKVGRSTYTLNHIAMAWVAPGAGFGLRIHFHMVVKLNAAGNAFTGNYTAAVYSVGPTDPFDESVQVASGTGTVSATRVNPD